MPMIFNVPRNEDRPGPDRLRVETEDCIVESAIGMGEAKKSPIGEATCLTWGNGAKVVLVSGKVLRFFFPKNAPGWIDVTRASDRVTLASGNGDRTWTKPKPSTEPSINA